MKKRAMVWLLVALVMLGGGAWMAKKLNWFDGTIKQEPSPREQQLAYLKKHEKDIENYIKSLNPKIKTVQIDWEQTKWGNIDNGTPQGGGKVVDVYGNFNNNKNTSWGIIIEINDDGRINLNSMALVDPLRIGRELYE